jgi:hypothetical protein
MDQDTNEPKRRAGGDHRTPIAKQQIAQREQQIVALRLRHHSFAAIGRVVGVTKQNAQKAYLRALHRNTDQDLQTHHRSELAELEMEAAAAWELVDNKDSPKSRAQGLAALNRIHIRRARLLGLDAPQKLDVSAFYARGVNQLSEERMVRQAVLEALPLDEQERIYDMFAAARKRAAGETVETTAIAVINGPEPRNNTSDDPVRVRDREVTRPRSRTGSIPIASSFATTCACISGRPGTWSSRLRSTSRTGTSI